MMQALVDATVLQLPETGVGKVALGLYGAARLLAPDLEPVALHRLPLATALPAGFRSWQIAPWLSARLWRQLVVPGATLRLRPQVIHFPWNGHVPRLPPGPLTVTTVHDVLPLLIPDHFPTPDAEERYRARLQRDIDRTDLLLTDSEYSRESICKNFKVRTEPVVIYPGVTPAETHEVRRTPPDREYFIYVGGYHRRKGLEALVRIFLRLHAEGKLTSVLLLTGTPHYLSEQFSRLLEEGQGVVRELGYLDDLSLRERLAQAKALVYPSKYEGFGLPPLEAMAAGCPVLTTRGTSLPEVCGDAAHYFDPDDAQSFASALTLLERDADLRAHLRARGLARARDFTWAQAAGRFLASLESALSMRTPRVPRYNLSR
jgi:glycosyltransferase involved in cell wall biosynthesis